MNERRPFNLGRAQNVKKKAPIWLFIDESHTNFHRSQKIFKPKIGKSSKLSSLSRNAAISTFTPPREHLNSHDMKIVKQAVFPHSTPISPRQIIDENDPFYVRNETRKRQQSKIENIAPENSFKVEDLEENSLLSSREDSLNSLFDTEEEQQKKRANKEQNYINDNIDYNKMVMDEIENILIDNHPNTYTAKAFKYTNETAPQQQLNQLYHNGKSRNVQSSAQKTANILNELSNHFKPR